MRRKLVFLDYDKGIRVQYNINELDSFKIDDIVDHVDDMFRYSARHQTNHEVTYAGLSFKNSVEVDKFLCSLKDLDEIEMIEETLRRC